jgi:hypothetical protein
LQQGADPAGTRPALTGKSANEIVDHLSLNERECPMTATRYVATIFLGLTVPLVAGAQDTVRTAAPPTGIVAGTVRDDGGQAVMDAIITVERSARQARSDSAGRFIVERVPTGLQEITIRRIGYRAARARLSVRPDSMMVIEVTMVSDGQRLRAVRIEEQLLNQLSGVVIDEKDKPIADAEVDVVGLRRSMRTDADGRFIFVDLPTGIYMLEIRKTGYRLGRRGVQMVAQIERDFTIRLYAGEDPRTSVAFAQLLAKEADTRKSLAGVNATFVTRSELERWKDAPLDVALNGSSGFLAKRAVEKPTQRAPDFPKSFSPRGKSGTQFGMDTGGARLGCVLIDGHEIMSGPALEFFRASEVELVEIFPRGSEMSRTLCSRFPPSSGCEFPPDPAGMVIWLKK